MSETQQLVNQYRLAPLKQDYEAIQQFLDEAYHSWFTFKSHRPPISNSSDNDNIEDMLGLLDAIISTNVDTAHISVTKAVDYKRNLLRLIAGVIGETQEFERSMDRDGQVGMSTVPGYGQLIRALNRFVHPHRGMHHATVVTFNYDIGLEACLGNYFRYPGIDCGYYEWWGCLPICKLHGSLNWYEHAEHIKFDRIKFRDWQTFMKTCGPQVTFGHDCHLKFMPSPETSPLIVAPTYDKHKDLTILAPVREAAAKALSQANYVGFCGFSLSENDVWFREFLRAYFPFRRKLRVTVFDKSPETLKRYTACFGEAVKINLDLKEGQLSDFSSFIESEWKVSWST